MVQVFSEVGRLRRVVIQAPGLAHERMLPAHIEPSSPHYALFDDLIDVVQARREHAAAQRCFRRERTLEKLHPADGRDFRRGFMIPQELCKNLVNHRSSLTYKITRSH